MGPQVHQIFDACPRPVCGATSLGNPKPLDLAGSEIRRSVISEDPLAEETSLRRQEVRSVDGECMHEVGPGD